MVVFVECRGRVEDDGLGGFVGELRIRIPKVASPVFAHRKLWKKRLKLLGKRGRRLRFWDGNNPDKRLALAYGRNSLSSLLSLWFLAAVFLGLAQTPLIRGDSY